MLVWAIDLAVHTPQGVGVFSSCGVHDKFKPSSTKKLTTTRSRSCMLARL
jgi:hypothetical protein